MVQPCEVGGIPSLPEETEARRVSDCPGPHSSNARCVVLLCWAGQPSERVVRAGLLKESGEVA